MPVTRILIEPGDYELDNMGCVAMLQVAVARLTRIWPDAAIGIITSKPEHLAVYCSAAQPVSRNGYRLWFSDQLLLGRLHKALPRKVSSGLIGLKWLLRQRWPGIVERLTRLKLQSHPDNTRDLREFLHAVKGADLLVILGPGSLTDHAFRQGVMNLGLIEMAISLGKHTAMVGQGLGPMRHPELTIRAKQILPKVSFIALREKRAGIKLLESVGVSRDKVQITGDDAIELAYENRLEGAGEGIGVALRLLHSSGVDPSYIETIRPCLQEFARLRRAPLIPVPISRYYGFEDARAIQELLKGYDESSDGGQSLDTPLKVIDQVSRCRIVVTGAYHSAVFALSQGIPTVCLAKSAYFVDKLMGLADQFGTGCEVVLLDSDLAGNLKACLEKAWNSAIEVRPALLAAAREQIKVGQGAYQRLGEIALTGHAA